MNDPKPSKPAIPTSSPRLPQESSDTSKPEQAQKPVTGQLSTLMTPEVIKTLKEDKIDSVGGG